MNLMNYTCLHATALLTYQQCILSALPLNSSTEVLLPVAYCSLLACTVEQPPVADCGVAGGLAATGIMGP